MSYLSNFNAETGKTILVDILKTVNQPENSKKLAEAKASSGKEMIKMMQNVFPLVMQIQIEVIKDYGFPGSREGLVQFEQIIREFEREDVDIARLRAQDLWAKRLGRDGRWVHFKTEDKYTLIRGTR